MNPPVANRERVYNYYNLNRLSWKCPECDAVQMHVCVHSGNGICRPLTRLTWPRAGVTYTNAPFPLAAAAIKAAPQASIYLQFDARTRWVNPRRRLLCENYGAAGAGDNYTRARSRMDKQIAPPQQWALTACKTEVACRNRTIFSLKVKRNYTDTIILLCVFDNRMYNHKKVFKK